MTPAGAGGWRARTALAVLGLTLRMASLLAAVSIGEIPITPGLAVAVIAHHLFGTPSTATPIQAGIVWDCRLTRALLAACCGSGLAVSGAVPQALLRNSLAEPYTLGISAGASTGAVTVILTGLGGGLLSLSGGAFIGAIVALLAVAALAFKAGGGPERIILAGVAGSQLFNAVTSYIVTTAANAEQARGVMFWLLGNLSGARWSDVALAAPVTCIALVLCLGHAKALDAFTFGADAAATLGISCLVPYPGTTADRADWYRHRTDRRTLLRPHPAARGAIPMTITLRDVRWAAGRRLVIDGVTLQAEPGRMLGLLGPNGSGKSSLLRVICGLRRVTSGVVTVGGSEVGTIDRRRLAQRMALVEQQVGTETPVTVLDVVRLDRLPHRGPLAPWAAADDEAVKTALMHFGLTAHRDQPWHGLSGGERQRAQIARALAQSPLELLLDEPTNHLDIRHQLDLLGLVSRLTLTVIVGIHDLNLAPRFCKEVVLLHEGRLVAAGAPEVVLTADRIHAVFGVKAIVEPARVHTGLRISYL